MIGNASMIEKGERFYLLSEHRNIDHSGPWRIALEVKQGKVLVRILALNPSGDKTWESIDKNEGVRTQMKGPKGWK